MSHTYNDILITTRQGINLWNALFSGHILNFYSYNLHMISGNAAYTAPQNAAYDFSVYVVFAIWNFPLWVLEKFFKIDVMNSIPCLMWSKAMLMFFLGLSSKIMKRICLELKMNEPLTNWCVFIYLSSTFVISSLFVISQYDIIGLFFMLIGLLMYLKNSRRKFVFWFAIAISFKLFALLLFIPLILLKEKRILHIFKYVIEGISLTILVKLIFFFDIATRLSNRFQLEMLNFLEKNTFPLSIGNLSIFFLLTALLYVYCYLKELNGITELRKFSIYISFLTFATFFGFAYTYPYWVILFAPFTIILIFQNQNKIKINLLLEIAMTSSFTIAQFFVFPWCFGIKTIEPMLLPKFLGNVSTLPKVLSVEKVVSLISTATIKNIILPFLLAVFVSCIISLAVINFPKNNRSALNIEATVDRKIIWARLAISGLICFIPIIGYLISVLYKLLFY
jgi:hypothetical protein